MSLTNAENDDTRTGTSEGWSYWLEMLRRIFPTGASDTQDSHFAVAIRDRFRDLYPLEDEAIEGVWYAELQALQSLEGSPTEVEARFSLSPQRISVTQSNVFQEPVHRPISVQRDFNEPQSQTSPRLYYIF